MGRRLMEMAAMSEKIRPLMSFSLVTSTLVTSFKMGFDAIGLEFDFAGYYDYYRQKAIINFCSDNLVSIGNRSRIHPLRDNKAKDLP